MVEDYDKYPATREGYDAWLKAGGDRDLSPEQIRAAEFAARKVSAQAIEYAKGNRPLVTSLEQDVEVDPRLGAPRGELEKTKLTAEQQQSALDFFVQIKPLLVQWIEQGKLSSQKGIAIEDEIKNLRRRIEADDNLEIDDIVLFPKIVETLKKLETFEISGATKIFDLLNEIKIKTRIFGLMVNKLG